MIIEPSRSAGGRALCPDGLTEVHRVTAGGIIAGATIVRGVFHPDPKSAVCDGPQTLTVDELSQFVEDMKIVREAYLRRVQSRSR